MDLKNNSLLCRNWIILHAKNRRRLFGRRSSIVISKTKSKFSVVILRLRIQVVLIVLVRSSSKTFTGKCFFFACCHPVCELVLKAVFEVKIKQVATSPDIPLFKKLKDNWKNIDLTKIQCYRETIELFRTVPEVENLFDFYRAELKNVLVRDNYRELIELSIVYLGGDAEKNLKSDLRLPCTKLDGWPKLFTP
ncbi:hypothetical protein AVEN_170867-1 [Araneus ventricosus]|uniref:Uncharacterized protein n=1 Tax=Araneus ventricosus TaxID=182803 RepID=A0A4Y2WT94_ARAVE|nr:hypothetical protein AVEN_170867-1 [Araneus ventricosus]